MFARISRRYDLLNTVMTAGRHYAWRRTAVKMVATGTSGPALDVASGTGDFAFDLARSPSVTGVVGLDSTPAMLSVARRKARRNRLSRRLDLLVGDAHSLPFPDDHFICVTVGFGIRNFVDVPGALREMRRVVRPGGRIAILEIVRIEGKGPWSRVFPLYFRYVTPWLGALLAGSREAYTYLPESVGEFLSATELTSLMEEAGLNVLTVRKMALGSVAIHIGEKR